MKEITVVDPSVADIKADFGNKVLTQFRDLGANVAHKPVCPVYW